MTSSLRFVLQLCLMSHTLTIRLTKEQAEWLQQTSRKTGLPAGRIVREQLDKARLTPRNESILRYSGAIKGLPRDLSARKGFSTK